MQVAVEFAIPTISALLALLFFAISTAYKFGKFMDKELPFQGERRFFYMLGRRGRMSKNQAI